MAMSGAASQVLALLVLDQESNRLAVKYCTNGTKLFPTVDAQRKFEKKVIGKLAKPTGRPTEGDVALIGDYQLVLYKIINDVYVCIVCSVQDNEVILAQLLEGLCQALTTVGNVSFVGNHSLTKQTVLENLDQVLLVLDEVADDNGIVMEIDEEKIMARIRMQDVETGGDSGLGSGLSESNQSEPERVFQQATQAAKKRLLESLLGGRG
ncbi:unnamed protein product [Amoebophrya sp. A120]|nr:unnamed protein product [Amoebophrya sp. A120]|eukprot:GSA120T00000297001.1